MQRTTLRMSGVPSEIVLIEAMVDFQGKTMAAIRCRVTARKSEPTGVAIDDEIPF
jgi:hypothetical protein